MSVFNGEKFLRQSIDSILNQTFTDFEFLIIDDCSTDATLEIIQQYNDPRIRFVKNEKNIGLTKSLNKGLTLANGEYIARMDADDISMPERFEKQMRFFDQNPETAVLGTWYAIINSKGDTIGERHFPDNLTMNDFLTGNKITHGSVIFKKAIITDLGGYHECFEYVQDYDLWLRVVKQYPIRNIPEILYQLRFHDDSIASKKRERSTLFHILTIKLARGEINKEQLSFLCKTDVRNLIHVMNKKDLLFYHNSMANMYIFQENIPLARKELKKYLLLNPFDVVNLSRFFLTLFGNKITQLILKNIGVGLK